MDKIFYLVYAAFLFLMSLIAFIFYVSDKKKAKKGAYRTPEATLLGVGFFGGAIGALLAMKMIRHKTKHWYFWVVNIFGLIIQLAIPVAIYIWMNGIPF